MSTQSSVLFVLGLALAAASALPSCVKQEAQTPPSGVSGLFSAKPGNFRLSLTDAPNGQLKSVFVNVKRAELRVAGSGKEARLVVAEGLGLVDLLELQNGVTLPMADLLLPEDVTITQIRLILEEDGNHIITSDGSRCDLKTPSAQKTGVKFIIRDGVKIERGYSYSILADFDAKKSIVLQGNGGCLLKPVLKLKSATRIEIAGSTGSDGSSGNSDATAVDGGAGDPIMGGEDASTQTGNDTGFDDTDPATEPPVVGSEEIVHYFEQ